MILGKRIQPRALVALGLVIMALRALLQTHVERSGWSSNSTDFALGVMMGVGIGLTLIGIWRKRREDRGASPDAC